MQVPATRHQVLKLWARHERRVITVPAAELFHGATEQHHGIGRRKSDLRLEREFALAGAELDFDGAQRQAKRDDLAAQDFENRLDLAEAGFDYLAGLEVEFHVFKLEDARLAPADATWPAR